MRLQGQVSCNSEAIIRVKKNNCILESMIRFQPSHYDSTMPLTLETILVSIQ